MRFCECGCGTELPEHEYPSQRINRFISGHNARKYYGPPYREEDRGYTTPCWIWQRTKFHAGYGAMKVADKQVTAHRVFYEDAYGPLGDRNLHHLCYVRACVNPEHLEPTSRRRHAKLEAEARSPLDRLDVERIRRLGNNGELTQQQLARAFKVAQTTISKILRRETWRDL